MIEIKALVADDDPQLQDIMVRRLQKAGLNWISSNTTTTT
jgi:hypothetical protein